MTEVGVSLALRRHRNLIGSTKDNEKTKTTAKAKKNNNNNNNNGNIDEEKRKRRLRSLSPRFSHQQHRDDDDDDVDVDDKVCSKKSGCSSVDGSRSGRDVNNTKILDGPSYSSWRILFEGGALYVFCMILPSILGMVARSYEVLWREGNTIFYRIIGYICSKSWLVESQRCRNYLPQNILSILDDTEPSTNSSVLAPDAGISDVAIVIFLSLSMAIIRVALVHFLVPNYKQPKRLEALVRCKSIHLLSSAYSGSVTPTKKIRMDSFHSDDNNNTVVSGIQLPNFNAARRGVDNDYDSDVQSDDANISGIEIRPMFPSSQLSDLRSHKIDVDQQGTASNNNDWLIHNDGEQGSTDIWLPEEDTVIIDDFDAPLVSSGLLTRNSAQNLQALLEQASPSASAIVQQEVKSDQNDSTKKEITGDRMYAAPKYATAVFRLIFCLVSCLIGHCYFGSAIWWPPAVGGTGNTRNCWDLSSVGVTNIVDSDFDSSNTALRRYYLIQASYHFHSAVFHFLTSVLLWFVSKSSRNRGLSKQRFLGFNPMGMLTLYNARIFLQHVFSLVLIFGTFLFSSTRRLGAIALIAFDASSLFLHLLQLGINAPQYTEKREQRQHQQEYKRKEESERGIGLYPRRKLLILVLHRFLVIPAFCYARFYVFPFVVCYSALEESQDWLHQLENMLIPGTAKFIHGFFVLAFLIFMLMNLIYFWRLLKHPHVTYTLQQQPKR